MDTPDNAPKKKSGRGFASMTDAKRREAAAKGGRNAHAKGTAYRFTSETASAAGKSGGRISRGGRGRLTPKSSAA